jgi:hypothetical protein
MVPQASHTGADGELEGAEELTLDDDGTARAKDIVTYPGGDRVDWKVVDVPKAGDVAIELRWQPPREGMDLSMNVYDERYVLLGRAAPSTKGKRRKEVAVQGVEPGRLYVQVYASGRKDAGSYTLDVEWTKGTGKTAVVEKIPDPPPLPKLACVGPTCPVVTPPCVGASCPVPPPCVGPTCPPPCTGPGCPVVVPPPAKKVKSAITELSTTNAGVVVVLNRGSDDGVMKSWRGKILRENGKPLTTKEYDLLVTQVSDVECRALVPKLNLDEIGEARRVVLEPPPPEQ